MEWQFAAPSPAAAPYFGAFYLATTQHLTIDDTQRAGTGHLHFFLEGSGYKDFPGSRRQSNLVSLSGPSFVCQNFALNGPARLFGMSLLPKCWNGMIPCPADALANTGRNAAELFGPAIIDLHDHLRASSTLESMAHAAETFFLSRRGLLAKGHESVVHGIRDWLREGIAPRLEALHARFELSDRQLSRIANRYWGAPPKTLARKYAALKTASHMLDHDGAVPPEALRHYSDQSHIIREVRRVTGQTPRQLRTQASPLMRSALNPANFWELQDRG